MQNGRQKIPQKLEKLKETPYWSTLYLVKRFLDVSCNFWSHSIEFLPSSWQNACGKWWVGDGLDWWHQCHFYGERDTFPDVNCVGCTVLSISLLVDVIITKHSVNLLPLLPHLQERQPPNWGEEEPRAAGSKIQPGLHLQKAWVTDPKGGMTNKAWGFLSEREVSCQFSDRNCESCSDHQLDSTW